MQMHTVTKCTLIGSSSDTFSDFEALTAIKVLVSLYYKNTLALSIAMVYIMHASIQAVFSLVEYYANECYRWLG